MTHDPYLCESRDLAGRLVRELKAALRNQWKRPLDICSVYEQGVVYKCCRYPDDPESCQQCGYLIYAEIDQTLKTKPSAIYDALKYF